MSRSDRENAPIPYAVPHSAVIGRVGEGFEAMPEPALHEVEAHLGGSQTLRHLGAGPLVVDRRRVSFSLRHANPAGVHTVVIAREADGFYRMDCYGARAPGYLSAPRIASAGQIIAENLATVLGQLTGDEALHHRHF